MAKTSSASTTLIGEGRPIRFCPICKQADDHPKHLWWGEDDNLGRHYDCCRSEGCPTGECVVYAQGAEDLRGVALRDHIEGVDKDAAAPEIAQYQEDHPALLAAFTYTGNDPIILKGVSE